MPFGIRAGLRRLLNLPRRERAAIDADMDDELRFFLEARVEHLVLRGMTRPQAEAEALARLGPTLHEARQRLHHSAERRERRMRVSQWMEELRQDLRYAGRGLLHSRGFALAVIVTLGLGVGANAAMFSIVDRLLFRPPALLRDPARVHRFYLGRTLDGKERITSNFQYKRYLEMTAWTTNFDRMAGFFVNEMPIDEGQNAQRARVAGTTASLFGFFDAPPALGRYFTTAEDSVIGGQDVAVLGYGYWQSRHGGAANVIGQVIRIGSLPFRVIGVAPRGFIGMDIEAPAAFIPLTTMGRMFGGARDPDMYWKTYDMSWMEMVVHRKPDVTVAGATTDLTTALRRSYLAQLETRRGMPPIEQVKPRAIAASVLRERGPNQGQASKVATWLIGVTAIVLLVACANVANLLLARAFGRRREIAVRLALGVSRGRLMIQLMTESLLLAAVGGALGLVIANFGGAVLRSLFLPDAEWRGALADGRTLVFATIATVVAGVLAGLVPAWQSLRADLADSLKAGVREGTYHRSKTRISLMVAQVGLSVVLLVGAGLFVRSLQNVQGVRMGFDPERLMHVSLDMRSTRLPTEQLAVLKERMREKAATLPGVEAASRAVTVPFAQSTDLSIYVAGIDSTDKLGYFQLQAGSPDFFKTVGTRMVRGRGIEPTDVASAPKVMVVSEGMAKALWPGRDPIGQCVRIQADTMPCTTVVGVVENILRESLTEDPGLQYYLSIDQWERANGGLFVRMRGDARKQVETVRRELQGLAPGDAFVRVRPMMDIIDPVVESWRLGATLFVVFGGLALVLATIGLYSLIAYHVAQRGHELGVRVALGAQGGDVRRLILGQGARLAVAGVLAGGLVAWWASRFVQPLLFGVSARDPLVYALVSLVLLGTAAAACVIPARRAARVDPLAALRSD